MRSRALSTILWQCLNPSNLYIVDKYIHSLFQIQSSNISHGHVLARLKSTDFRFGSLPGPRCIFLLGWCSKFFRDNMTHLLYVRMFTTPPQFKNKLNKFNKLIMRTFDLLSYLVGTHFGSHCQNLAIPDVFYTSSLVNMYTKLWTLSWWEVPLEQRFYFGITYLLLKTFNKVLNARTESSGT